MAVVKNMVVKTVFESKPISDMTYSELCAFAMDNDLMHGHVATAIELYGRHGRDYIHLDGLRLTVERAYKNHTLQ